MKPVETYTHRGCRVLVFNDENPIDPRVDSHNFGTMICWHNRYILGDQQPKVNPTHYMRWLAGVTVDAEDHDKIPEEHITRILEKYFVMLPLYLYDHSGITMSTGLFSCGWDSGQVGFIYVSLENARKNWMLPDPAGWDYVMPGDMEPYNKGTLRECAARLLKMEVQNYDQFLTGQVYGYQTKDWEGNNIDSGWGFFGSEETKENSSMVKEAKGSIDDYIDNFGKNHLDSEHDEAVLQEIS